MPIRPKPFIICCRKCGWSAGVRPRTDIICESELPRTCPQCHNEELQIKKPKLSDIILHKLGL